jgi:hypothetical protein
MSIPPSIGRLVVGAEGLHYIQNVTTGEYIGIGEDGKVGTWPDDDQQYPWICKVLIFLTKAKTSADWLYTSGVLADRKRTTKQASRFLTKGNISPLIPLVDPYCLPANTPLLGILMAKIQNSCKRTHIPNQCTN